MTTPTIKRNDPCPCGSGKKYKQCCMKKQGAVATRPARPAAPDPRETLRNAQANLRAGRIDQAGGLFRRVLDAKPKSVQALFGLGQVLCYQDRRAEGLDLVERAMTLAPKDPVIAARLATLFNQAGRYEDAQRAARRALGLQPANVDAMLAMALAAERMAKLDEAAQWTDRALAAEPGHAEASLMQAKLARRAKDMTGARDALRALLDRNPSHSIRGQACHELGFVLDKLEAYDEAFAAFEAAAESDATSDAGRRIDRTTQAALIESYRAGITPALTQRWPADAFSDDHPRLAFLVGFPRSGTTMTERVLGAHPAIATLEEESMLDVVRRELLRTATDVTDVPAALARLDADRIRALRDLYWSRIPPHERSVHDADVVIDKLPLNIVEVGLINVVFPDAKILLALRDPRDVCLSCFMQDFRLNEAMLNFTSWERTAAFYAEVMSLWRHLREVITLPVHEARYESTVTDLEGEARAMLDFLGVTWDDAVLHFHQSTALRHSNTPSYEAVRQRVHTGAVNRWRNYEAAMARIIPTLEPLIDAFGYS